MRLLIILYTLLLISCEPIMPSGKQATYGDLSEDLTAESPLKLTAPRKITNLELHNVIEEIFPNQEFSLADLPSTESSKYDTVPTIANFSRKHLDSYYNTLNILFKTINFSAFLPSCKNKKISDGCNKEIADIMTKLYRRPPSKPELVSVLDLFYVKLHETLKSTDDAKRALLLALIISPNFLFVNQRGTIDSDQTSLAARLSFFLWSSLPDQEIIDLAKNKQLSNPEVLKAQVDRMLADSRSKNFVKGFSRQWMGTSKLKNHKVDITIHPTWTPQLKNAMTEQMDSFFEKFLRNDIHIDEFLTSKVDNTVLASFNAAYKDELDVDLRLGALGLPGFLTITSKAFESSPTHRAKEVLARFMCTEFPPLPPEVQEVADAKEEEVEHTTLSKREKFALHREDQACAVCHDILDPFGMALEHFNAIGELRAAYANSEIVDAVTVDMQGNKINGLKDLSNVMVKDVKFKKCFTKNVYSYGISRVMTAEDKKAIKEIEDKWTSGKVRDLLKLIVTSETFIKHK